MAEESCEQQKTAKLDPLEAKGMGDVGAWPRGIKNTALLRQGRSLAYESDHSMELPLLLTTLGGKERGAVALSPGCKLNSVIWAQNQKVALISLYSHSS